MVVHASRYRVRWSEDSFPMVVDILKHSRLLRWPTKRSRLPVLKHSRIYFDAKRPETYALREAEREDILPLIEQARAATARAINSAVILLYWPGWPADLA
jgi:hypothetical protein